MRNHYQITITDCHRARHYTLTEVMRRAALAAGGAVGAIFLGGLLVIYALSGRVEKLDTNLADLSDRNAAIQERNAELLARHGAYYRLFNAQIRPASEGVSDDPEESRSTPD